VLRRSATTAAKKTSSSSGATTAASGLQRDHGNLLWSFQTGAGANDAPTIFKHNGKEYVVFYAGGIALAATPTATTFGCSHSTGLL